MNKIKTVGYTNIMKKNEKKISGSSWLILIGLLLNLNYCTKPTKIAHFNWFSLRLVGN